jgi:hypothetical protein
MIDSTNIDCQRTSASSCDRRDAVRRDSELGDHGSSAAAVAEVAVPGPSMADRARCRCESVMRENRQMVSLCRKVQYVH